MDLIALQDFNLVAAHGGFGRASRATGRPKATLSRRVFELEQQLGVRLLERGAHALRLTQEGHALQERTATLLSELAQAVEAVTSGAQTPRGRLRISAPVVFAHVVLSRLAARFVRVHTEVQLEVVAEDRVVDLVDDGYDIVVRIDPVADDRLVGRRIATDRRWLVAAPGHPRPAGAEPPTEVPAVLMMAPPPDEWHVVEDEARVRRYKPVPVLRLSSLMMIREAVVAGTGVALLPRLLVADDVEAGRLLRWGIQEGPQVEIWALQNSRRLASAKVRAFLEFLKDELP